MRIRVRNFIDPEAQSQDENGYGTFTRVRNRSSVRSPHLPDQATNWYQRIVTPAGLVPSRHATSPSKTGFCSVGPRPLAGLVAKSRVERLACLQENFAQTVPFDETSHRRAILDEVGRFQAIECVGVGEVLGELFSAVVTWNSPPRGYVSEFITRDLGQLSRFGKRQYLLGITAQGLVPSGGVPPFGLPVTEGCGRLNPALVVRSS